MSGELTHRVRQLPVAAVQLPATFAMQKVEGSVVGWPGCHRPTPATPRPTAPQKVPRFLVSPCSVSETVTSENLTVIGGLQSGWKLAVRVSENSALPFCTGKSPSAETDSLFSALGCLAPGLMHSAVAVTSMWTWVSLPRPASLPETRRMSRPTFPLRVSLLQLATDRPVGESGGVHVHVEVIGVLEDFSQYRRIAAVGRNAGAGRTRIA